MCFGASHCFVRGKYIRTSLLLRQEFIFDLKYIKIMVLLWNIVICWVYKIIKKKFRDHHLPRETGRWLGIPINDRRCTLCNSRQIADEMHALCSRMWSIFRWKKEKFSFRPITFKCELMSFLKMKTLKGQCKFILNILYEPVCPPYYTFCVLSVFHYLKYTLCCTSDNIPKSMHFISCTLPICRWVKWIKRIELKWLSITTKLPDVLSDIMSQLSTHKSCWRFIHVIPIVLVHFAIYAMI